VTAGRLDPPVTLVLENFPDDPEMRVSHETIYLSLFVQSRGALREELTRFLRTGRANRRPLGHSVMNGQGQLRGTGPLPRQWSLRQLPEQLRRSITWDQGKEMAQHARFSVATGVPVYFCDPRSPWQRGSNENTNGLLRQYFPKRSDLKIHTQADLDAVADELNERPRQTLHEHPPV
jgi:transposase, IS30 family